MTANSAIKGLELLRQEVPENLVGKLPRVTCGDCRKNNCSRHQKAKCTVCGGWLGQHMHLDYVGHAETTAQLLEADLAWNWEPLAFGPDGLPAFDADGGLWIKLTVCGVTRLGYGTADNANGFKARGDIRKEIIGDALRNAAMRFGFALNLWAKTDIHERAPQEEPAPGTHVQRSNGATPEKDPWASGDPQASSPGAQPAGAPAEALKANKTLLRSLNIEARKHATSDEERFALIGGIIGRAITTTDGLSVDEATRALKELSQRAAAPPQGWTDEQRDQLTADLLAALLGARSETELVAIGNQIADAFKAKKITEEDRQTLLAGYKDAQAAGRKASATHREPVNA